MKYLLFSLLFITQFSQANDCTYSYTIWNTFTKSSEGPFKVKKKRTDLKKKELGPKGCSICEEDQVNILLSNGIRFRACRFIAEDVKAVLETALGNGTVINSVVGYRAQVSRGKADHLGRRTVFSNHSYGVAIDINENSNGLYDNCIHWNERCRLIKGGKYDLRKSTSLQPKGLIVTLMKQIELLWGGEIRGKQKDFMHFSPTGY